MALSNIFREPRREIIESAVGLALAGGVSALLFWADYSFAAAHTNNRADFWLLMFFGVLGMIAGVGLLGMLVATTHQLGEAICNRLEAAGIHLRPRNRR